MTQRKSSTSKAFAPPPVRARLAGNNSTYRGNSLIGTNLDIWHSEDEPRLGAVLAECWHLLSDGVADPQHDFHTLAMATTHAGLGCTLRTVVLRKVNPEARELWFYTDLRSHKIGEIQNDPRVALLFHSLSDDTQVRVQAEAAIHHRDTLAEDAWQALTPRRRRDYLVSGPRGLPWAWATSGLPAELEGRDPTEVESDAGRLNFAVVVCHIRQIDWLLLTPYGHRRANFSWSGSGQLQTSWLVP